MRNLGRRKAAAHRPARALILEQTFVYLNFFLFRVSFSTKTRENNNGSADKCEPRIHSMDFRLPQEWPAQSPISAL